MGWRDIELSQYGCGFLGAVSRQRSNRSHHAACVCGLGLSVSRHCIPEALFLALLFSEEGYSWGCQALGNLLTLCMSQIFSLPQCYLSTFFTYRIILFKVGTQCRFFMLRVWFGNGQLKVCVVPHVVLLAWQPKKAAGCQVQLVYVGGVGKPTSTAQLVALGSFYSENSKYIQ